MTVPAGIPSSTTRHSHSPLGGSSISNTDANIALPSVSASHLAIVVDSSFAGNFAGLAEMQIYSASTTGATPHDLTVDFGTGDGSYTLGESVAIAADTAPSGQVFSAWTGSVVSNFADVNSPTTTFTMTDVDTTLTATYAPIAPFVLTVEQGSGDGSYLQGQSASLVADAAPAGQVFSAWTGSAVSNFADVNSATTTFTMPAGDTIITATYIAETYSLTVDFGTGDGSYTLGESASLVADAAPVGKVFLAWAGSDVSNFADVNSSSTTFTMPAGDTTLTATYVAVPFVLTVDFGTGDGSYTLGESVAIAADTAPSGQVFSAWTGSVVSNFADVNSATTTFTMTDVDTTITANYAPVGTGNAVIPAGDLTVISSSQYSIADAAGAF